MNAPPSFYTHIMMNSPPHTTWRRWAVVIAGCAWCGALIEIKMSGYCCSNDECPPKLEWRKEFNRRWRRR